MKRSFVTLLLMLAGFLLGTGARAEAFIDLYGGGAFTSDARSGIVIPPQLVNPTGLGPDFNFVQEGDEVDTNFEDSVTYGMRAGYWFGRWFGLAVDAFTFEPNLDVENFTQDGKVRAIPISLLLLLRWPLLASEEYPLGRLHPYVGGGPSLFITHFEGDADLAVLDFSDDPAYQPPPVGEISSRNVDPGLEVLVGVDFQILPFIGLFGEYRYTLAEPVWSETLPGIAPVAPISTDLSVPLRTHHIVGGITFRF